jgi:hypothetical protein
MKPTRAATVATIRVRSSFDGMAIGPRAADDTPSMLQCNKHAEWRGKALNRRAHANLGGGALFFAV